jgi:phospholipid/cholesterol/gamma-HCH transport system ATP-binding protein
MNFFKCNDLKLSIDGREVLCGTTFSVDKREKIGIIGPSGSGKSILFKVISDIYPIFEDSIVWFENKKPSIGLLFQEGALFDSMNVLENVMFPLRNGKSAQSLSSLSKNEARDKASIVLNQVGLSSAINKEIQELSGGMRKRVGIARALVHEPDLLLLDEPTSGLDPVTANTIMDLIDRLTEERSCTTMIISHDLRRLLPRVPRVMALEEGKVVFDSNVSQIKDHAPASVVNFISTRFSLGNDSRT